MNKICFTINAAGGLEIITLHENLSILTVKNDKLMVLCDITVHV